ncbi:hypothetical protein [Caproiciproducens galactitolivorans]|uniref:Uncharacterized protein n=1 Tax=Caproiciproducens galactitolivorans TaxID=642589 RepID=A0ABT4BX42_9FIRM|nr:hypothetical protein [Caproiciproducens galactitolivorans]MCY1714506.1 hypothetical protein [Caproiciproducens galactitolivorans]
MSLNHYTNSPDCDHNECDDHDHHDDCDNRGCDKDSAKALKRILELLDDLNDKDLRLLDDIIDRLLCSQKC